MMSQWQSRFFSYEAEPRNNFKNELVINWDKAEKGKQLDKITQVATYAPAGLTNPAGRFGFGNPNRAMRMLLF